MSSEVLSVDLVEVGQHAQINFARLVRTLNKLSKGVRFRHVEEDINELQDPSHAQLEGHCYFDPEALIRVVGKHEHRYRAMAPKRLLVGVTSVWLADSKSKLLREPEAKDIYFGYWQNEHTGKELPANLALISLAPWMSKYEELARRDIEQYVAFMIVSFIGDYLAGGKMTHAEFRWCAYDYNPDLDSILWSIRKSSLCNECARELEQVGQSDDLDGGAISRDIEKILGYTRKPSWTNILRSLQENSIISLLVFGLFMSVVASLLANVLTFDDEKFPIFPAVGLAFLVGIGAFMIKERFWPGPRLG